VPEVCETPIRATEFKNQLSMGFSDCNDVLYPTDGQRAAVA